MDRTLVDFVRVLRNADVRVSPAETLDALHAVQIVGINDRQLLKTTLATSLAKSYADKEAFEYCFDQFFSQRGLDSSALQNDPEPTDQEIAQQLQQTSMEVLGGSDSPTALSALSTLLLEGDQGELAIAIGRAASAVGVDEIRYFTQKGLYSRRTMDAMGLEQLDADIHQLEQLPVDNVPGRAEAELLRQRRHQLQDQVRNHIEQQYLLLARQQELQVRDQVLSSARLSNLDRRDLDRVRRLIQKIARKLAARYSARRRSFKRGQLDVPSTLRAGMATDGVLFNTHWKRQRRDRPCVYAICDVSGSVSAYARFLLMFLYSLNEVLPRVRSFVFSSKIHEVSALLSELDPAEAIDTAIKQHGMSGTDYAAAFNGFLELTAGQVNSRSTVIILGDARNNYGDPAVDALRTISSRAKRLLWLNPESKFSWQTGDSEMLRYQPCCTDARTCQTLQHLERFGSDLLRHQF